LCSPAAVAARRGGLLARVALVGEREVDRAPGRRLDRLGQLADDLAVADVGRRDDEREQVPERVDGRVRLRALAPLGPVVAGPAAAGRRRLERPAVEHGRRRPGLASSEHAEGHAEVVRHLLGDAGADPALGLLEDGVVRREVAGEVAPRGTSPRDVAEGVEDASEVVVALGASSRTRARSRAQKARSSSEG
jgi:hypothetical protein